MRHPLNVPLRLGAVLLVVLAVAARADGQSPAQLAAPEIRALWVDAFHAGIRSATEASQLVADAKRLNVNTLIVQVRRRGDALYASGLEPPLDDPAYDPSFDALANILREAHAAGLQVHAWINAMPLWRDEAPPRDGRHVFNRHGTAAAGDDNWLTRSREGNQRFPVGYFLDPGHPAARDHLVSVYVDIVRHYPVDGIHFDYIRYPETDDRLPRGSNVGYNPVSVARFAKAAGRGTAVAPAPDDEAWTRWRRQQVTELVRRISIEARAINPKIKVSAAVIAWGRPPRDREDFANTAPMQRIFQDWRGWLEEGILDLAVPMNYAREHDATVREWFNGWIEFEKKNKRDRQLAVGVGGYLSEPGGVLAQIGRVRTGRGRGKADGVSIFSYSQPSAAAAAQVAAAAKAAAEAAAKAAAEAAAAAELSAAAAEAAKATEAAKASTAANVSAATPLPVVAPPPRPERLDFLVTGVVPAPGAFRRPAPVPSMPWIERPTRGYVAGSVADRSGPGLEGVRVRVSRRRLFGGTRRTVTDANGWFGMTNLKPGRYRVELEGPEGRAAGGRVEIEVKAGQVSRAALTR